MLAPECRAGTTTTQDTGVDVGRRLSEHLDLVHPVGHQTAVGDIQPEWIDRRQAMTGGERDDEVAVPHACRIWAWKRVVRYVRETDDRTSMSAAVDAASHTAFQPERPEALALRGRHVDTAKYKIKPHVIAIED